MAKARGFTLIEMVVALAIMALSLGVLFRMGSTGMSGAGIAAAHIEATRLAQSRLDRIGAILPLRPGVTSGEEAGGYSWRVAVSRVESRPDALSLFQVEVTVFPPGGGKRHPVTLVTRRIGEDHSGEQ